MTTRRGRGGDRVLASDSSGWSFIVEGRWNLWSNYRFSPAQPPWRYFATAQEIEQARQRLYDIRGPVLEKAKQMEEEGHKIIKLNIGNLAVFGFEPPDEIVQDMIRNLPHAAGYTDSKGLFAPRKAVMHYTQKQDIAGVTIDDVYLGNGASELIAMSMNALLNDGDEVLVPAPDYPLWTAAVSLSGGTPVHYVCDEQSDWMPDIDDMRAKITPRTSAHRRHQPEQPDRRAVLRTRCCCRSSSWRASTS